MATGLPDLICEGVLFRATDSARPASIWKVRIPTIASRSSWNRQTPIQLPIIPETANYPNNCRPPLQLDCAVRDFLRRTGGGPSSPPPSGLLIPTPLMAPTVPVVLMSPRHTTHSTAAFTPAGEGA